MKITLLLLCSSLLATANLLKNPGFETMADGRFADWSQQDFRTRGQSLMGNDGGHTGHHYARLQSADQTQREAWLQRRPLPSETLFVLFNGWYRTRGYTQADGSHGPSFRIHWFDRTNRELHIDQKFLPCSADWKQVGELAFAVPEGAVKVEVQVFNWLIAGETHWDDVSLEPVAPDGTAEQMARLKTVMGIDREPVDLQNLPYSPADGSVCAVNPPPFLWLPMGKQLTYELQICRRDTFDDASLIHVHDLPWCMEMLSRPLAAGHWYWRYGVRLQHVKQVLWSRSRSFEIAEGTHEWPFPQERLSVSASRPRLFFTPATQARMRQGTVGDDNRRLGEALARRVSSYAGETLIAEPGWLPSGAERARKFTEVFRATRPPMDRMEEAALAYVLTGDAACGAEAKRRVLHFFSWDPNGPTNTVHNDEPAMWVMMRGCRAYDWTYELYTPAERKLVEDCMVIRAKAIYDLLRRAPFENNPYASHSGRQIGFLGEACLLLLPEHPELKPYFEYIMKIYWGVYPAWGKEDGGWNEGPHYWSAYMGFGLHFIVALRQATGIDLSAKPFFSQTPYYAMYQVPPKSRISPFGDGNQYRPNTVQGLMTVFGDLMRDPYIKWYGESMGRHHDNSILGLVLRDDSLQPKEPVGLPQTRLFPGVGLVLSHTALSRHDDDIALYFRSSPYGAVSHGHNDQNCFALEAFGEGLAIPTGNYDFYNSPHHDRWTRQTKAKCGITIDGGQGQDRGSRAKGRILYFHHDEAFDAFAGDATAAYGGRLTKAIREIVHVRPGFIVIRDTLAAPEQHSYEYWLHAYDEMSVDNVSQTVLTQRPQARLTTMFLAPKALKFSQTNLFDPPVSQWNDRSFDNQWHLMAASQPTRETVFISVLQPQRAGDTSPLPKLQLQEASATQSVIAVYEDGRSIKVTFASDSVSALVKAADSTMKASLFVAK